MQRKRVVLAGFRGHSRRWFEYHGELIDVVATSGPLNEPLRGKMAEAGYEGRHYDDPREMLEREEAEMAFIWTPRTEDHVPLGLTALERGMHVMLEKPLSEDLSEARRLVDAARQAGRLAMVMQDIRWQTAALEVKEALDAGTIGQPYWLEVSLRGRHSSFIYEGIHLTDLARFWYDRPAEWVMATGASPAHHPLTRDNIISLLIGFQGCATAKVTLDWSSQAFHHWIQARLQGDRGAMTVTWGEPIRVQCGEEAPRRLPKWDEDLPSMRRLLTHFLECIDTGREPVNGAADHLKTLEIIFAGWRSFTEGERVAL